MGDVANCVTVNVEIKSLTEDVDQMISDHIDAPKAIEDSTNVKLRVRLEREQFLRSAIPDDKIILTAINDSILRQRQTSFKSNDPDKVIFKDLEDVKPWDESFLVPEGNFLTQEEIKSVKKGMLEGKLYNISKTTLKYIYPVLPKVSHNEQGKVNGWSKTARSRFRCTLCSRDYSIDARSLQRVYHHIEQFHSSSLVTCMKCDLVFTSEEAVDHHLQVCKANHFDRRNERLKLNNERSLVKHINMERFERSRKRKRYESSSESDSDSDDNSYSDDDSDAYLRNLDEEDSDYYESNYGRICKRTKRMDYSVGQNDKPKVTIPTIEALERAGVAYRTQIPESFVSRQASSAQARRFDSIKHLIPDPEIFENLESVEPWDVNLLVPLSDEIKPPLTESLKKGMSMGLLYNINRFMIAKILPIIKSIKDSETNSDIFFCPLCSWKLGTSSGIYSHIESVHTNHFIVCKFCEKGMQTSSGATSHKCFIKTE